jgi:hypothetical protein
LSFASLKQNRAKYTEILQNKITEENKTGYEADPLDWYPAIDKAGNGLHMIRFLPQISDDDIPYVRWWSHNFQDLKTKKYYIENCLYSLDKSADPVMEFNRKLWDSVEDSPSAKFHRNRIQATRQARKLNYRANIYVIEDSVNPENNGKVKKFKFGKWAFDKIEGVIKPKFTNKKPIDPFDLWTGANFRIEIFSETKDGKKQRNYSGCAFETPEPLGDEDFMESVFNQIAGNPEWSIKKYLNKDQFKSYEELKKRLDDVVGFDTGAWTPEVSDNGGSVNVSAGSFTSKNTLKVSETKPSEESKNPIDQSNDFFANLKTDVDDDIPF